MKLLFLRLALRATCSAAHTLSHAMGRLCHALDADPLPPGSLHTIDDLTRLAASAHAQEVEMHRDGYAIRVTPLETPASLPA